MDYNYSIMSSNGNTIKQSHMTNVSKSYAIQEARKILNNGTGDYALITSFDWRRGNRIVGRINPDNQPTA